MAAVVVLSGTLVYPIVFTVLSVVGAYEMLRCVGTLKNPYISVPSLLYAAVCPAAAFYFRYGFLFAITLGYMFFMLIMLVAANEKVKTDGVCASFTMITYITICFSSIIRLRYVTADHGADTGLAVGQYVYFLIFIAAWVTDTFAYFTGVFFGKHKLCPKISPKKTVEGSVGGVVFCVIAFAVYGLLIGRFGENIEPNFAGIAIVGCAMSIVSQFGDLLASVIKRTYGIKDYGKLFPGHGGVLDRFDSVLLLAPFLLALVEDSQFLYLLFRIR